MQLHMAIQLTGWGIYSKNNLEGGCTNTTERLFWIIKTICAIRQDIWCLIQIHRKPILIMLNINAMYK